MAIILENRRHIVDINKKNRRKKSKYTAVLNLDDDEVKITVKIESEVDGVIENLIDEDVDYYELILKPVKAQQPPQQHQEEEEQ